MLAEKQIKSVSTKKALNKNTFYDIKYGLFIFLILIKW